MAKVSDEGTSSPFSARLYLTPLALRDVALEQDKVAISEFDKHFALLIEGLTEVRDAGPNASHLLGRLRDEGCPSGRVPSGGR
jgi:hypothetical protein